MRIVVAVIFDDQGRVLITRRAMHSSHGGMWEFPGGKLEAEELPTAGLIREIKEEVGLDILTYSFLGEIVHDYGTKIVNLLVFRVEEYWGEALLRESQLDLRWVEVKDLSDYSFPAANGQIIELISKGAASLL